MDKINSLKNEIEEKKRELANLEENQRFLEKSGPEYVLAVRLHSKLCRWNHTDGCGWFYAVKDGKHDWSDSSHRNYLEKARKILRETELDVETIIKVLDNL